jgi:hypothetical protein
MATTTFNDLITFSRGSNATVTGPNGLIQWAPSNLVTNSQDFEAAAWIGYNATATSNIAVAPDGSTTADKIVEAAGSALQSRYATSTAPFTTVTTSIYAKAAERTFFRVSISGGGSAQWFGATFDVQNGVVTQQNAGASGAVSSAAITPVGNGWYRCTVTGTTGATSGNTFTYTGPSDSGTPTAGSFGVLTYTGTATFGVLVWGAQLELGSTAATYNNTSVRNLLGFSEAFDNAAWTKSNSSIVTGAQANPVNGLFNAQKLMEDTANAGHFVQTAGASLPAAGTYVCSVYAKAAGRTRFSFVFSGGTGDWAWFDLSAGTATVGAGTGAATITSVGNGWFRCSFVVNAIAAAAVLIRLFDNSTPARLLVYTGDGNSGVYIYGAMLSNSASLDPYVPTPGAAPSSTAYYGPRFDYDPVTLLPRGLLIEEQRTNLQLHSGSPQNAAGWTATTSQGVNAFGSGSVANAINAPDGTQTAAFITEDTTGGTHYCFGVQSSTATTKTWSVWLKAGTRTRASIQIGASGGTVGVYADINLTNGTIGAATVSGTGFSVSGTPSIQRFGNDWYRCSITAVTPASAHVGYIFLLDAAGNRTYTGNGPSGLYVWGGQLEDGAFATSYIPTIASTVTRSADVAAITGSLFSQWYGQSEGSFVVDVDSVKNSGNPYGSFVVNDGTSNNRMAIIGNLSGTNAVIFGATGGVDQFNVQGIAATTIGTPYKMALAYAVNNFATSGNGGAVATDTLGSVPTVNRIDLGYFFPGTPATNILNGHIRSIRYVPVRAADFQLQQVTT